MHHAFDIWSMNGPLVFKKKLRFYVFFASYAAKSTPIESIFRFLGISGLLYLFLKKISKNNFEKKFERSKNLIIFFKNIFLRFIIIFEITIFE